jgi:hypothetical protein
MSAHATESTAPVRTRDDDEQRDGDGTQDVHLTGQLAQLLVGAEERRVRE